MTGWFYYTVNMLHSGIVTFLFTDLEGSTPLLQELGPAYADRLAQYHAVLRAACPIRVVRRRVPYAQ